MMTVETTKRRGRPKSDIEKKVVTLRLRRTTQDILNDLSYKTSKTKGELVDLAMEMLEKHYEKTGRLD